MNNLGCGAWIALVLIGIVVYAIAIIPASATLAFVIGGVTGCDEPFSVAFPLASIFIVECMIAGIVKK